MPRNSNHPSEAEDNLQVDSEAGAAPTSGSRAAKYKRPMGMKCTKEEVRAVKQGECAVRAQAQAAADMAATNKQKA